MNRRDIELLSAYLDGELKASESTRLETRLKTDPELASVFNDLRATRTLLRRLPTRKAPRNFTLTRKMVGQNPPLPRAFPVFRLATMVATLLLFFSFGVNFVGTQLASQAPAYGMGGGGGGGDVESYAAQEAPAATEEPAAAPMAPAAEAQPMDATSQEPSAALVPQGTEVSPTEDMRVMDTPAAKNGAEESTLGQDQLPPAPVEPVPSRDLQTSAPLVSSIWQIGLAIVAALGLLLMWLTRQLSARRWK